MRFLITLFLSVVLAISLQAQSDFKSVKIRKEKGDLNCLYKAKYSVTQRKQFYPFRIADTIKLISFRYHWENYPIKADTVVLDSIVEIVTLKDQDINELTDILYNNFYRKRPNYGVLTQCFLPRNAILFYDKFGKLSEHILLCFHCDRYQVSSDKIEFGDDCSQKIEKLRQLFISLGLKFGTDIYTDTYPGEDSD